MKTSATTEDTRDASLRVSKRTRDSLKAAAAVMGRPLYDVTNEAIDNYLAQPATRAALNSLGKRKAA